MYRYLELNQIHAQNLLFLNIEIPRDLERAFLFQHPDLDKSRVFIFVSTSRSRQPSLFAIEVSTNLDKEDDFDDVRNVRPRSDAAADPVPDAPSATPDAPDAPRRNDPVRELLFGPVNWKANINRECRTIITEGMKSHPNMRGFFTRRGPDN
ncbi:hypothetical protein B0H19DRAFT_1072353 [Mycena capillaripes]|nr:hypothetical protein B0H19DRAFT_1072353 [Mycena capillaripes]